MAKEFIDIVGFQEINSKWQLTKNDQYKNTYSIAHTDPKELSAEICAYHLLKKIDPDNKLEKY